MKLKCHCCFTHFPTFPPQFLLLCFPPGSTLFVVAGLRFLKTSFGSPGWMGNESSSVRIHPELTAGDLKGLRAGFPGGGNGPPPQGLTFGPWDSCWHPELRSEHNHLWLLVLLNCCCCV